MTGVSKYVVCPYYHTEQRCKILCEGVQADAYNHLVFQNDVAKKMYMKKYCRDIENFRNCRICEMLDLRYLMETGSETSTT